MREILPQLLWIGNAADARSKEAIFANEIAAVVDLAIEEPPAETPREIFYLRIPIEDGANNSGPALCLAVTTVANLLAERTPTLVCCSAGMSRSPTIATFAIARYQDKLPQEILKEFFSTGSHDISPALWNAVTKAFEQAGK